VVGLRERKKAATRESLIDAAQRLFTERGVDATTMDDVAAAANTSRTSVFNYFGYKEALLVELGARYVRQIAEQVAPRRRRSVRARLEALADALADLTEREPALIAAIAREMTHPDQARRRFAIVRMQYPSLYEGILGELESHGWLRHPRRRHSYERQLVDITSGTLIRAGGDFPIEQLRAELHANVDVFMDGAVFAS
jgi:AcrR family transcriptional regulator